MVRSGWSTVGLRFRMCVYGLSLRLHIQLITGSTCRKLLLEKCGVIRLASGAMDYLRDHILDYMRAQAKDITAFMLFKLENLKDVSEKFRMVKRASGQERYITIDGRRIRKMPDKIMDLDYDDPRLTMSMDLLERVIIKVATNGRFITNNAGPKMRVTLTVKDMMVANALDNRLTDSLDNGLPKVGGRKGSKKAYNWTKIRENMINPEYAKYKGVPTKKSKKDDCSDENSDDEDSDDNDDDNDDIDNDDDED